MLQARQAQRGVRASGAACGAWLGEMPGRRLSGGWAAGLLQMGYQCDPSLLQQLPARPVLLQTAERVAATPPWRQGRRAVKCADCCLGVAYSQTWSSVAGGAHHCWCCNGRAQAAFASWAAWLCIQRRARMEHWSKSRHCPPQQVTCRSLALRACRAEGRGKLLGTEVAVGDKCWQILLWLWWGVQGGDQEAPGSERDGRLLSPSSDVNEVA